MGRTCSDMWLPIILKEMENPSPEMRHAAAFAAGEIGEEEAVMPLSYLVARERDATVQQTAIQAITEIGGPQARVALKNLLYEGDDSLKETIQEALTELEFNEDPLTPPGL
jgi:HEAT repeat protein